ncbi:salivary glue protein Sgs-3-like [Thrips palmi]|uniref:Salivary glue protein Sgs-3-like n=1 Tax=Thrips palmi TaxID=161013 RepID=A0A6P9A685_THRPL|nr:salivary glue protein Sgs-3-like [Thrips palmi]
MAGNILGGLIVVLNVCIWASQAQNPPTCTVNGRIAAVPGTCSNLYYLCYNPNPNGSGTFSQWLYACPGSTVFNELSQRCSTACAPTTAAPVTTAPTTTAAPVTTVPATTAAPVTTVPDTTAAPVTTVPPTTAAPVTTVSATPAAPVSTADSAATVTA